jgi:hypothetical protein
MVNSEKELLEGYMKLPPESQNFILSTVITAVTAQEVALQEFRRQAGTEPVMEGSANG